MKLASLNDLFVEQLEDVYSAETQLIEALPKMAQAAQSPDVKKAFEEHLAMTRQQHERLDQVFESLNSKPSSKKCKGMEGLIKEGDEVMKNAGPAVMDAALIAAAQKVEHYEIATYGTLKTYAQQLGHKQAARLLQQTLKEESQTDKRLTEVAEMGINQKAEQGQSAGSSKSTTSTSSRQASSARTTTSSRK